MNTLYRGLTLDTQETDLLVPIQKLTKLMEKYIQYLSNKDTGQEGY